MVAAMACAVTGGIGFLEPEGRTASAERSVNSERSAIAVRYDNETVPATHDLAETPDPRLVALYRALGDGTRLRILRRLAAGPATVGRIGDELGLAKSTVHEHLFSLRTAGLVRLVVNGGFALEPEIPDLNRMLKEFLGLEMRRQCEGCAKPLRPGGVAFICSFECTFCDACATRHRHVCPNCGGELVRRPRRASNRRAARTPSITTHLSAPGRH
ncbi:MAG: DUF1272 domain-containing protein [Candidatus Dormiibacterota bacterium]